MSDSVIAPLNYLAERVEQLETWSYDPPDGRARFNGRLRAYQTTITNARECPEGISHEHHGFSCLRRASSVSDFLDEESIRKTGYAEAVEWVKDTLQTSAAIVFDHTYRRRLPDRPPLDGTGGSFSTVRTPVGRVHADFTPNSAPNRVAALMGYGTKDPLPPYRIYGLWRPLNRRPLQDAPLALAKVSSVTTSELVPNAIIYPDRRGETYAILHSHRHQWFYFPAMQCDEVLLFLHYDSKSSPHITVPHTAFEDPTSPPDAKPRESLEMRILVF